MLRSLFFFLRPALLYLVLVLAALGWFAWGSFTGTRLLGDDNESTETLAAPGTGRARGTTGYHARYYHK